MKECRTLDLIAMVYKSIEYTEFIVSELSDTLNNEIIEGWNLRARIVANDPEPALTDFIEEEYPYPMKNFSFEYYNDPKPKDYYLNRVYRCWNYAGFSSSADSICFINSDMLFSKDWLRNLLKHHNGKNIPCSRLVESGKMPSGKYAISKDFGRSPNNLDREGWRAYAESIKQDTAPWQGLYMPCIFETKRFIESGGYPEGNMHAGGPGDINSQWLQSGDDWYFQKLEREYGMKHVTVFDSLVYHIQEGEKSS